MFWGRENTQVDSGHITNTDTNVSKPVKSLKPTGKCLRSKDPTDARPKHHPSIKQAKKGQAIERTRDNSNADENAD